MSVTGDDAALLQDVLGLWELHVLPCPNHTRGDSSYYQINVCSLSVLVRVVHSWATFFCRNQLSRHSRPPNPPPLCVISCLTLSPSPFVLFHWPCMFQKQISFSSTVRPPHPHPNTPLLQPLHPHSYLLSKSKPRPQFLSKSTISPPHCSILKLPPTSPPTMLSHAGIWRRVPVGCPPIPSSLVVYSPEHVSAHSLFLSDQHSWIGGCHTSKVRVVDQGWTLQTTS